MVETVLGVQFPEIKGFHAGHFGRYWNLLGDRYPDVADQARLDLAQERFPRPPLVQSRVQLLNQPPLGRVWFTASSKSELIQLQPDRFHFNWRRKELNEPYPSYQTNSRIFFDAFDAFLLFCESHKLPPPIPKLCEVTYVNHIDPGPDECAIDLAGKIFTGLCWQTSEGFLPTPESATFNRAFVISDAGKAMGRLYAAASIATRPPGSEPREFVLFNITARVNCDPNGGTDLRDSMQLAHDWVVRGFADLTDDQIQRGRWEREE